MDRAAGERDILLLLGTVENQVNFNPHASLLTPAIAANISLGA